MYFLINDFLFYCFFGFLVLHLLPIFRFKYFVATILFFRITKLIIYFKVKKLTKKLKWFLAIKEVFTYEIFYTLSLLTCAIYTVFYFKKLISNLLINSGHNILYSMAVVYSFCNFLFFFYNFFVITRFRMLWRFSKDDFYSNKVFIQSKQILHFCLILSSSLYILFLSFFINTTNLFYFVYFSGIYILVTILSILVLFKRLNYGENFNTFFY